MDLDGAGRLRIRLSREWRRGRGAGGDEPYGDQEGEREGCRAGRGGHGFDLGWGSTTIPEPASRVNRTQEPWTTAIGPGPPDDPTPVAPPVPAGSRVGQDQPVTPSR